VRALGRFRWLLPALAVPVCVAAVAVAIQAATFGRAPEDALGATGALRVLVRYHVMRATESLDGRTFSTSCIAGWFRPPRHRRLVRGSLVLIGKRERLYSLGSGVRRLPAVGRSRPASLEDRVRFVLAACPHYLDDRLATHLLRGRRVEAYDRNVAGTRAVAFRFGNEHAQLTYTVARTTNTPLALSFTYGQFHGTSELQPGGGDAAMNRVRLAFNMPPIRRHRNA
jgi:hypothetical protein